VSLSPLHLAVLSDDLAAVKFLSHNPELLHRKNGLGFTPVELAGLLAKYDVKALLEGERKRKIAIQLKGKSDVSHYFIDDFEENFGISYLETVAFQGYPFLQKVVTCCPLLLRYTFLGKEHRYLGSYYRQKLMHGFIAPVSIRWIDEEMGYGLFAEADFAKDTYVGEYAGVVRLILRGKPDLNGYCLHYPSRFFSYDYFVIDALRAGNETRFMNHSDAPNVQCISLVDRDLCHVGFFTTRAIAKGEEITFNYGKDYWRKRNKLKNRR
jgi:hypothetical protein